MDKEIIAEMESLVRSLKYNELYKFSINECNGNKWVHIFMNITESNFYVDISTVTKIKYDFPSLTIDTVNGYVFIKLDRPHIDIQL